MVLEFARLPIIHLLLVLYKLFLYSKERYHFHANRLLYIIQNNKTVLECIKIFAYIFEFNLLKLSFKDYRSLSSFE